MKIFIIAGQSVGRKCDQRRAAVCGDRETDRVTYFNESNYGDRDSRSVYAVYTSYYLYVYYNTEYDSVSR